MKHQPNVLTLTVQGLTLVVRICWADIKTTVASLVLAWLHPHSHETRIAHNKKYLSFSKL